MEFPHDWTFTPDMFYPPNQQSYFLTNTSTQRQRPTRIVKPTRYGSPQNLTRRKSNSSTQTPSRTRSVVDARPSFPQWHPSHIPQHTRPISWHPGSFNQVNLTSGGWYDDQASPNDYLSMPFTTAQVNGLVTPLSLPVMDEPRIQELVTPLDELSRLEVDRQYGFYNEWQNQEGQKFLPEYPPYSFHDGYTTNYENMYNQFGHARIATAPASPTLLPPQIDVQEGENGSGLKGAPSSGADELVAMGLYDSPAQIQSGMLFEGSVTRLGSITGKGLKLEDSFEPPEADPDADGDDGDDEDDEEEEEDEEEEQQEDESGGNDPTKQALMVSRSVFQPEMQPMAFNPSNPLLYYGQESADLQLLRAFADQGYINPEWQPAHYPYGWI